MIIDNKKKYEAPTAEIEVFDIQSFSLTTSSNDEGGIIEEF